MKKNISILYILVLILHSACTEKMDITLDSTFERIVIEGYFTDEYKQHQVKITNSADYFSNKPVKTISGASVSINDGTNTFILTEDEPGIYKTDSMSGVPGRTYTLNIDIEGTNFTASNYMYNCPTIDSLGFVLNKVKKNPDSEVKTDFLDILIYAQEPGDEENHYAWKAYKNDTLVTDTLREVSFADDVFINGSYVNGVEVQTIEAGIFDTIKLEMLSINKDYYDFMLKVMLETDWDGGPFDGPPANFYGNISNGALGFFAVYSIQSKTQVVPADVSIEE